MGPLGAGGLLVLLVAVLAACGGGGEPTPTAPRPTATPGPVTSPTARPAATPTPAPTATPQPAATPAPAATSTPAPTAAPAPVATTAPAAPTATTAPAAVTPEPTAAPAPTVAPAATTTPAPEPTPVLATEFVDDFGFVLNLDLGADVRTAGWTEVEPDAMQGTLSYTASGVSTILIWGPQEARPPVTFLADTYNILRGSQPELNFDPISDGEITVSGEQGVYGGFRTIDASDATLGGGLIGTWVCSGPETAYRLTLTGEDAAVVQLRFDRLLDQFACAS